ncbi:hypothetical protein ACOME3_008010 [Neoechinorhynchus agilis]
MRRSATNIKLNQLINLHANSEMLGRMTDQVVHEYKEETEAFDKIARRYKIGMCSYFVVVGLLQVCIGTYTFVKINESERTYEELSRYFQLRKWIFVIGRVLILKLPHISFFTLATAKEIYSI